MQNRLNVILKNNEERRSAINRNAYLEVNYQVEELVKMGLPEEVIGQHAAGLHRAASWASMAETSAITINEWAEKALAMYASIFSHEDIILFQLGPEPVGDSPNFWKHAMSFKDPTMKENEFFVMGYLIKHRDPLIGLLAHIGVTNYGGLKNIEVSTAKLWMNERARKVVRGEV